MSKEKKSKEELVWLLNVAIGNESLMFQFPTQAEQLEMVEQIKDRVDSYNYALNPVKLIKKSKSKSKSKSIKSIK